MDNVLYNQIINELNNDIKYNINDIKNLIDIYGNYHSSLKKYNYKYDILVDSNLIITFLKKFNINEFTKLENKYTFKESLSLISNLSSNLYISKLTDNKKLIINALNSLMQLLFKDYLVKCNRKYNKIVLTDNYLRSKEINELLSLVSRRIKLIDLYKLDKLNSTNIIKLTDNKLIDYITIEDINNSYKYLYSNLLCDLLYNDNDKYIKVSYLVVLLNNTKNIYFNNLIFPQMLNITSNNLKCNNNLNSHNLKSYKLALPVLFFTGATILFVYNVNSVTSLNKVCEKSKYNVEEAKFCFNQVLNGEVLKDGVTKEEIDLLSEKITTIDAEIENKLDTAYEQIEAMEKVNKKIEKLFISDNLVKDNVSIKDRFDLYNSLIKIPQESFVLNNMKYIDLIDSSINKREVIELTKVPFVSQKDSKIYNGCEAASLLMALKYKDLLLDYDLKKFVEEMPKHDFDPHQGFIHDIYSYEPRNVVHWIAPDALSKFANKYTKATDISGSSVDELKLRIKNNEPVIVYVTSEYKDAKFTSFEVPLNLHVVLLVGYNQVDGSYIVMDPYYGKQVIDKAVFEKSYNYLKYAVSVS